MTQPVIIVIAYNRPQALKRILLSLSKANYEGYNSISLVISIDGGGVNNVEVECVANSFNWGYGDKTIINYKEENLGLRKHVLTCGNMSSRYGNIIMLEEDCYVSRNYYDYACKSLDYYIDDDKIAGISLYSYNCFESVNIPFSPLSDGNDVYFLQVPSSLGQVWSKAQWEAFMEYYETNVTIGIQDKLPEKVKTWPDSSWKKYFYKYLVDRDLYFVYPQVSFTTNFGDVGTHFSKQTYMYQVNLEYTLKRMDYKFIPLLESNNIYDAFFELLPSCYINLGVDIDFDTCIDLMGAKNLSLYQEKYSLSIKSCLQKINSYGVDLHPIYLNVLFSLDGDVFSYARTTAFQSFKNNAYLELTRSMQSLSYDQGCVSILTSKEYKLGAYILNPIKFWELIKKRVKR